MEPKTLEQTAANPLATAPIGTLLCRYSIPTTLTLLVNYLYNIADQIFVGQGVGITGMAATNVAFPLTIVTIALALLLGDGCAANLNLCLGRGEQDQANRIISHTASLMVGVGILLGIAGSLLAKPIVILFGATETSFQAALDYTRIIAWGLPFLLFSSALAAIIRADGNPKFTMKCMILGAAAKSVSKPMMTSCLTKVLNTLSRADTKFCISPVICTQAMLPIILKQSMKKCSPKRA